VQYFVTEKIAVNAEMIMTGRTNKPVCAYRSFWNDIVRIFLRLLDGGEHKLTPIASSRCDVPLGQWLQRRNIL
jgi:hypothetical protein